jgi:glycosyltransferase involved in cell wall biosynthesis/ribosomal protein S18 acetylase RimI-like enzyme
MRILIVSQWYPPDAMKLLSDQAETLREFGHDVEFMAGLPNWPSGRLYPGYKMCLWMRETQKGVPITRLFVYPDHSRSGVKRALNFLSYAASATVLGPFLMRCCDAVYFVHPPATAALPAVLLSRLWDVPMAMEIQDMWPETLEATGMVGNRRVLGAMGWFCSWVYRRASAIRVISDGFKRNLVDKGVPADKVHVMSNWVDTDFYRPVEPDPDLVDKLACRGRFTVMFAGTVGLAQGLDVMLEAAAMLDDSPLVQFLIVGDGADSERLQEMAQRRNLANVRFLGRYPADAMAGMYAVADVLFVHLRDHPLFRITIPHKIFTYLASGKPILAAMEGDARGVVESARAGLCCPPGNPRALADTVRAFLAMEAREVAELGANGRRAALEHYSRRGVMRRIADMVEEMVARDASGPTVLFYRGEGRSDESGPGLPEGFAWELWSPSITRLTPPGAPAGVYGVWLLFHFLRVFWNRGYAVLLVRHADRVVHRSLVTPGYFRFPFMGRDDLQIGDTWTDPEYRGRGLAAFAIRRILAARGSPTSYWYVVEPDNTPSIRAAEKAGLRRVGSGVRRKRYGLHALGSFTMVAPQAA